MSDDKGLTVKKNEDFSQWYTQVVQKAELADIRYNVKGFVVFRPWAVLIMNKMFQLLEQELEKKGHQPALFPALIPESNFKKEAEHVEGFLPEVFWVTEAGGEGEKIDERLALRPTSETAMYQMFALWIRSWRDLPFKIYQRCQVWRYEGKATRPFIRSREFYWIETHNAFATLEEAEKQVQEDMETTDNVIHKEYAIPFLFFQRPEHDKFAGAVHTYAADTLMPDGKVLQLPSTHLLGQNFSKSFEIKFVDKNGESKYVWQTCYGPAVSRIIAAVISMHGDNKGLVLPPTIAPIQVIIIPIITSKENTEIVLAKCKEILESLEKAGVSPKVDADAERTPGWKFNYWELKGVPLRIEIGPRDIRSGQVVIVRRDNGAKQFVKENEVVNRVKEALEGIQKSLSEKAYNFLNDHLYDSQDYDEVKKILADKGGLVRINWCGLEECAEEMKNETNGGVIRGTLLGKNEEAKGNCIRCGNTSTQVVYISKQY
ncbi:MAG: prolyl-tRNA synthetase [Thermoproteota archaeon]|nr:prolyl-tRNA synthetase [Thermoproteota archaeon]